MYETYVNGYYVIGTADYAIAVDHCGHVDGFTHSTDDCSRLDAYCSGLNAFERAVAWTSPGL